MSVCRRTSAAAALLALSGLTLGAAVVPTPAWAGSLGGTGWFHDPVSPAQHAAEIPVPSHPRGYHGPTRWTHAHYRSFRGQLAVPAVWAIGHTMTLGQTVTIDKSHQFRYRSASPSPSTRALLRHLRVSFANATMVRCDGYADPVGVVGHERQISLARARAICALLRAGHPGLATRAVGRGGAHPARVGGTTNPANRRVLVQITRARAVTPPPALTAPSAPRNVSGTPGDHAATLTFTAPASDGGAPIQSYEYADGQDGWQPLAATGDGPLTSTVSGLAYGTHTFQVRAVNDIGAGAASEAADVRISTVPDAPLLNWARLDLNSNWMLVSLYVQADNGSPITAYQWRMSDSDTWTDFLGFSDTAAAGGATYGPSVFIRAVNADGPGPSSNPVRVDAFW